MSMMTNCVSAALVALAVWADCASAAEIHATKNANCAFSIEGPIAEGDYDRLASLVSRSAVDPLDERSGSICLKSPGGVYSEGLKIAELIFSRGLSTVIEFGAECYSSCALIFMAGVTPGREVPSRKLSAGGVLGFHAPYLSAPDKTFSKEQVENATQAMRVALLELLKLASKRTKLRGGNFIKPSLVKEAIGQGPRSVVSVRTIFDAARWDITIYDAQEHFPKPSNIETFNNLCNNFHFSNMDEPVANGSAYSLKVEEYASKFNKKDFRVLVNERATQDTICEIYPREDKRGRITFFACSHDYWSSKSFGNCRDYLTAPSFRIGTFVPEFFVFSPVTPLLRAKN